MDRLTQRWAALRRRLKAWLRAAAQRVDPDRTWHLPDTYSARDVARFHDLMIDIGWADAYDEQQAQPAQADGHLGPIAAGIEEGADTGVVSTETAAKIRNRALSEEAISEMHDIVFDLRGRDPMDVPVDVSVWGIGHFIAAYAQYANTLCGTQNGTASA